MKKVLKIVLVEPSLILRSGLSYVLRRLALLDVELTETGDPNQAELLLSNDPDVLIVNPSAVDESVLKRWQRQATHLIALQSSLMDVQLNRYFESALSIYDTAEQIKEKLMAVCDTTDSAQQEQLSAREKEIIVGVVKGYTNKQIAEQLFISTHTVITHRRNIAAKLQIHSPAGLTIYAIVNKLVELDDMKSTIYSGDEQPTG
jgi:DNA-binding NarL/FixJ family response regulator